MRTLKPSTILLLGAPLTGVLMSAAFLGTTPAFRNPRGFSIAFGGGLVFGLLMLLPIALAEGFRDRIRHWLERYGSRFCSHVGFVMAMALGYWFASMRHQTFDTLAFVAGGLVFIGALIGMANGVVSRDP